MWARSVAGALPARYRPGPRTCRPSRNAPAVSTAVVISRCDCRKSHGAGHSSTPVGTTIVGMCCDTSCRSRSIWCRPQTRPALRDDRTRSSARCRRHRGALRSCGHHHGARSADLQGRHHRHVGHETAVDERATVPIHRREDSGDGRAGQQRGLEVTMVDQRWGAGVEVHGHSGEGNCQVLDPLRQAGREISRRSPRSAKRLAREGRKSSGKTSRRRRCAQTSSSRCEASSGYAAAIAPVRAPTDVPMMRSGANPRCSSACTMPTWDAPNTPPPPITAATGRGRDASAAQLVSCGRSEDDLQGV